MNLFTTKKHSSLQTKITSNYLLLSAVSLFTTLAPQISFAQAWADETPYVADVSTSQGTINYHSVEPEVFHGGFSKNSNPDILIIVDTSGSMGYHTDYAECADPVAFAEDRNNLNDPRCAAHPDSRSSVLRNGLREVLTEFKDKTNVGIMSFRTLYSFGDNNNFTNIDENEHTETNSFNTSLLNVSVLPLTEKPTTDLTPLDGFPNNTYDYINKLLQQETTNETTNYIGLDIAGQLNSKGGTPIEGSLLAAYRYFKNQGNPNTPGSVTGANYSTEAPVYNVNNGTNNGQRIDFTYTPSPYESDTSNCPVEPIVILVTDGRPTSGTNEPHPVVIASNGDSLGGSPCYRNPDYFNFSRNEPSFFYRTERWDEHLKCSSEMATILKESGIKTYVIGFTGNESDLEALNEIAKAGSDQEAYSATDSDGVVNAFLDIYSQLNIVAASSTNASIVSSETPSTGSAIQAKFKPLIQRDTNGDNEITANEKVTWTGDIVAYFIDEYGIFREDKGTRGTLDDITIDRPFVFEYDKQDRVTQIRYIERDFKSKGAGNIPDGHTDSGQLVPIEDVNPIWSGADWLNSIPLPTNNATRSALHNNRDYKDKGSQNNNWRYIITKAGRPNPQDNGEPRLVEFRFSNQNTNNQTLDRRTGAHLGFYNHKILDFSWTKPNYINNTRDTVNFIRGDTSIVGMRNRVLDGKPYRLGDILTSSPAQVDKAIEQYEDESYKVFKKAAEERRRVVYVGANDGMIHAFNSGFWNNTTKAFDISGKEIGSGDNVTEHELGAELWAYVPRNLLPHLSLLTKPNYSEKQHVSFVDGDAQTFDVKLWDNDDEDHPGGWGTILVIGMNLGGRERTVQMLPESALLDRYYDIFTGVSSYIVMDVTNPEKPPVVLAEINDFEQYGDINVKDTHLRFTTGKPTVKREGDDFFLILGSGPTNHKNYISDKNAHILKYKLKDKNVELVADESINKANSFTGDLIAHRWAKPGDFDEDTTRDESHDAVYFGLASGDSNNPNNGGMYRSKGNGANLEINMLIDTNQPVIYRPNFAEFKSEDKEEDIDMVIFGTGRELTINDYKMTDSNSFYGVVEDEEFEDTVSVNQLINVTNISISDDDGTISGAGSGQIQDFNSNGVKDVLDAQRAVTTSHKGWLQNFPGSPSGSPSHRSTAVPLVIGLSTGNSIKEDVAGYFVSYLPPKVDESLASASNSCSVFADGTSYLYPKDLRTGLSLFQPNKGVISEGPLEIGSGNSNDPILVTVQPRCPGGCGPIGDPDDPNPSGGPESILKFPLSTREIAELKLNLPDLDQVQRAYRKSWTEINFN